MVKFKVGDKVIAKKETPYSKATNGWIGTVTKTCYNRFENIYVEDESKNGYWVVSEYFNPYYEAAFIVKQITIERTNEKTIEATAFNESGNIIAKAKAKCSPEDKWDFYVGANLAVERLEAIVKKKKEKATSLNAEIVCIKNSSSGIVLKDCFTVGKIYNVKNGIFECNHGSTPSIYYTSNGDYRIFKSVEEINAVTSDIQFLEIIK